MGEGAAVSPEFGRRRFRSGDLMASASGSEGSVGVDW